MGRMARKMKRVKDLENRKRLEKLLPAPDRYKRKQLKKYG